MRGLHICPLSSLLPDTFQKLLSNPEETRRNCLYLFPSVQWKPEKSMYLLLLERVCGCVEGDGP